MPTNVKLAPVSVIIRGPHDTGRTTLGNLLKIFLEEHGYADVKMEDTTPLPPEQKGPFQDRFERNRARPVRIFVETVDPAAESRATAEAFDAPSPGRPFRGSY